MKELKCCIKKIILIFKSKDTRIIGNIIKKVLTLVLILCFLKLPFVVLRDIVSDYFYKISTEVFLSNLFYCLFEILYFLFVILIIKNWLIINFGTKSN